MNGFENENEIITELNSKCFHSLSSDMQNVIMKINNNLVPDEISATKYAGQNKADLCIKINNYEYYVSVKKGTGNSVHQESVEGFILFLKTNFEDNISVFNDIRHFVWGDLTLDGTGNPKKRISALKYKNIFPAKIINIQNYFNKYKRELLERFLITGVKSNKQADYILYGNINSCHIAHKDQILNFAINSKKKEISIGVLSFQAWNRNLNCGDKSEHKRGQIQLKWGAINDDILNL